VISKWLLRAKLIERIFIVVQVKDMVTTARRGSADTLSADTGVVEVRSVSAERCPTAAVVDDDDDRDPWVEQRPRTAQGTVQGTAQGTAAASPEPDLVGRSSASPPRSSSGDHRGRKRFSVSQTTSTSVAATARSSSPLDLAGLLGTRTENVFIHTYIHND